MGNTRLSNRWNDLHSVLRALAGAALALAIVLLQHRAAMAQEITPGRMDWSEAARGFEVAELPVLEDGLEVDRLHLARIMPQHFRFEIHTAPEEGRNLDTWLKATGAVLIVNGSFFDKVGKPATPVVSRGRPLGPVRYGTKHGAFVVREDGPAVLDLRSTRWQQAFQGASEAMVSFPMLIGADGRSRALGADPDRFANRTFIGQDKQGRILVGTTASGYFSLDRFADFLIASDLGLTRALNLDGGPPACQAIEIATIHRRVCSNPEFSGNAGQFRVFGQLFGQRPWGLPIVLAVLPK